MIFWAKTTDLDDERLVGEEDTTTDVVNQLLFLHSQHQLETMYRNHIKMNNNT